MTYQENNYFYENIGIVVVIVAVLFALLFFPLMLPREVNTPISEATQKKVSGTMNITSHTLKTTITNQWYSSALLNFPSQALYAMPLVFKIGPSGLGFSYPQVTRTVNTIAAPYIEDFTVGFPVDVAKPTIDTVGDWTIGLSMKTKNKQQLSFVLGHGLPFSILHTTGSAVKIHVADTFTVSDKNNQTMTEKIKTINNFAITIRGHTYLFVFPKSTVIHIATDTIIIDKPEKVFIGLLDKKEHYEKFLSIGNIEIYGSEATPVITDTTLSTKYTLMTNTIAPLVALYPHQYDFLKTKPDVIGSYETLRGNLSLIQTNDFTTVMPLAVPSDAFAKTSKDYPDLITQVKKDIQLVQTQPLPTSEDYYLGTWFGKIDNLLLLADTYGLENEKKKLLDFTEPVFLKSMDYFMYNQDRTTLIAKNPEFGNEKNNDHHFHYGYYIRTAAVLSKLDPSITEKIKGPVTEMVNDIMSIDKNSSRYPYLRHFDIYEGHSWADGYCNFSDGCNQESSSEAINAWYGVYLWSNITGDTSLKTYASYLYTTEIVSTQYYWFDIKNMYTSPYAHAIASLVWGGKVDYSTWFSPQTNMIYGIQLLPFTPASDYLGKMASFDQYNTDYHTHDGNEKAEWGDLFLMWKSFYQPAALKEKDAVGKLEADNTKSMLLYELYKNGEK